MSDTETIEFTDDEASLIRSIVSESDSFDVPLDELEEGYLELDWDQARALTGQTMRHMTEAMATAHESATPGGIEEQHQRVQSINQKVLSSFRSRE